MKRANEALTSQHFNLNDFKTHGARSLQLIHKYQHVREHPDSQSHEAFVKYKVQTEVLFSTNTQTKTPDFYIISVAKIFLHLYIKHRILTLFYFFTFLSWHITLDVS